MRVGREEEVSEGGRKRGNGSTVVMRIEGKNGEEQEERQAVLHCT